MKMFLSKNKFYTFILLILPVLIIVSWLNVFAGNANYTIPNYILTFILPAVIVSYGISLLAAEYLHEQYGFTYKRVLFALIALVLALLLYSFVYSQFGLPAQFLTAAIPSVQQYESNQVLGISTADPREIASKFYSFQLILAMLTIVIAYSLAIVIFPDKDKKVVKVVKEERKKEAIKEVKSKLKTNKRRESAKKAIKKKAAKKKTT